MKTIRLLATALWLAQAPQILTVADQVVLADVAKDRYYAPKNVAIIGETYHKVKPHSFC